MRTTGSKWYEVRGTDGQTVVLAYNTADAARRVNRRRGKHNIGKAMRVSVIKDL